MAVNGTCTGDDKEIQDGRKSFPSGHSSYSMFGMVFLALWFAGKLGWHEFYTQSICVACISLSLWIGVTRYADYQHHPIDIICNLTSLPPFLPSFVQLSVGLL
jgi:membrane-associated phospholipid phosphatase